MSVPGALLVSEVFPPAIGGSGVLFENVYSRLGQIPVTVLSHGPGGSRSVRSRLDVQHVDMAAPDWGIRRPASILRHVRLARAIRRLSVGTPSGFVHCGKALPEGFSARLAQLSGGAPYLCWVHGEELGLASTSRELGALTRRTYARARAVVANSENSRHLLVRDWNVSEDRVHVVHPGVDVNRFRPDVNRCDWRHRYASDGETLFLSVGRLQRRKGHDLVLKALARWPADGARVRYLIAGDGPELEALKAEARSLRLGDLVVFIGAVSETDLPSLYAACDVFVMPNRREGVDFEGFGIVFLEAAASGLPTIGGKTGGVPEAVEDAVTGILIDGTDAADLASAMRQLTSQALRNKMGAEGRARVIREFTWERAAHSMAAIHEGLLRQDAQPARRSWQ